MAAMPVIADWNPEDQGFWERFSAWLDRVTSGGVDEQPEAEGEPEQVEQTEPEQMTASPEVEKLAAIQAERDELAAKLAQVEAQQAQAARVAHYTAELSGLPVSGGGEMLATMTDEQAAWVVQQFAALGAQITANDALTRAIGSDKPAPQSPDEFIKAYAAERGISYVEAFEIVRRERPEIFK